MSEDLKHAHSKRIDVDFLIVGALFIHVRSHELRCSKHAEYSPVPMYSTEPKIADAKVSRSTVDEDVLTLEIAMNDRRILRVQILEPVQNLNSPSLGDLPSNDLNLMNKALEGTGRQNLGHKVHFLSLAVDPRSVKADDVVMVQSFQ